MEEEVEFHIKGEVMKKLLIICGVISFLVTGFIFSQEQSGRLVGKVKDEDNALLSGVIVEAESPALMGKATAKTNDKGRFRLINLPPGTYAITFSLDGFRTLKRKGVVVKLGSSYSLNVTLTSAIIEE